MQDKFNYFFYSLAAIAVILMGFLFYIKKHNDSLISPLPLQISKDSESGLIRSYDKELNTVCYTFLSTKFSCVELKKEIASLGPFNVSLAKDEDISRYLDRELGVACYISYDNKVLSCLVTSKFQ